MTPRPSPATLGTPKGMRLAMEPEHNGRISRRRMLKAIGAGTAVAWSTPILTSIRTPAFAQYAACAPFNAFAGCPADPSQEFCGTSPNPACDPSGCGFCSLLDDGSCLCSDVVICNLGGDPACQSDADCGPDYRCGPVNPSCGCSGNRACFHPCVVGRPAPRTLPQRGVMIATP